MTAWTTTLSAAGVSNTYQVMLKKNFWDGNSGIGLILNFSGLKRYLSFSTVWRDGLRATEPTDPGDLLRGLRS